MYMYLGGGSRHFHKGEREGGDVLFSETIFFLLLNIKRYRDVIQSENYKTWQKEN
jgi:hypothetical protein